MKEGIVTPAKAGIQLEDMDSRLKHPGMTRSIKAFGNDRDEEYLI